MAHRVRSFLAGMRLRDRTTRGPADGLLAEIQAETLARHPEWHARLAAIEAEPVDIGPNGRLNRRVNKRWRRRA